MKRQWLVRFSPPRTPLCCCCWSIPSPSAVINSSGSVFPLCKSHRNRVSLSKCKHFRKTTHRWNPTRWCSCWTRFSPSSTTGGSATWWSPSSTWSKAGNAWPFVSICERESPRFTLFTTSQTLPDVLLFSIFMLQWYFNCKVILPFTGNMLGILPVDQQLAPGYHPK